MAFEAIGGHCKGYSEICPKAIKAYCENFDTSDELTLGDITKINNIDGDVDVLLGGVPCQSWSIAGRNLGFEDDRGQLWNDTLYLLNKKKPKCFLFENVKGLVDPRNADALKYIMERIKQIGYHATYFVLNSYDFGLVQNRIRIYIVGFKDKKHFDNFEIPKGIRHTLKLFNVLDNLPEYKHEKVKLSIDELFKGRVPYARTKFQKNDEFNDFFVLNDIRDGHTAIHSWDIIETTKREKHICYLLLKNRRKSIYGALDGNPLSEKHFKSLDESITKKELQSLVGKGIFKNIVFTYTVNDYDKKMLTENELTALKHTKNNILNLYDLKLSKNFKKIYFSPILEKLTEDKIIEPDEIRYDFRYTKISSGINGVCRIYLPNSDVFSTLVASDTNDFVATKNIFATTLQEYHEKFINEIYLKKNYRKITKEEACDVQGFPRNYKLPERRADWMKLLGNSVSVPVIKAIAESIRNAGVF